MALRIMVSSSGEIAGFNDRTWLDHDGHPHTEALRTTERFHRRDIGHLDVQITFDDPKAYTKTFSATKVFRLTTAPMGETLCAYSEMKEFQENVVDKTQTSPGK